MGVYLSTPNTEISFDNGEGYGLRYSVGEIQGWRKSMEDAHIACTDLAMIDPHATDDAISVFGVFDGHGGKEVAKFCQLYFLSELVKVDDFYNRSFGSALKKCFHRMDEMLEDTENDYILQQFRKIPNPSDKKNDANRNDSRASDESSDAGDDDRKIPISAALNFFQKLMESQRQTKESNGNSGLLKPQANGEHKSESKDGDAHHTNGSKEDDDEDDDKMTNGNSNGAHSYMGSSMICTLPDHRVIAGCTAVVALKYGKTLYVANAGDSRAVLCLGDGTAYALSNDHKPADKIELDRITNAGGFVNGAGRINGNLNLSRAIGDLKYKQNRQVGRAGQMITAEPDISITQLNGDEQFMVLACDGVWDCFSNQDLCNFICERLANKMIIEDIVKEVFTFCVSRDPRETGGIGGDNMTCIIVKFDDSSSTTATNGHNRS